MVFYDTDDLLAESINLAIPKKPHSGGNCRHFLKVTWADEIAEWVKKNAAKPDNPCLVFRSHRVEGETQLPQVIL